MAINALVDAIGRRLAETRYSLRPDMEVDSLVLSVELHNALLEAAPAGVPDYSATSRTLFGLKYSVDTSRDCAPLGVVCRRKLHADALRLERVALSSNRWRLSEGVHVCDCDFTDAQARALEDFISRRRAAIYRAMPLERRI